MGRFENTLERQSIERGAREGIVDFKGKKVMMVCGVDRLGMGGGLND
jgi:hypothetical protein